MPLSNDEIERLIVSMEANTDRFDKAIAGTNQRLDAVLSQMEKRADRFQATFEKAMSGAGTAMRRVMEGIGIGLSFEGLKNFVEHVTETAMNVKKQSAAIGVSAQTFQAWSIMARTADVDQQVLNTTLERFASNIGMAQLKVTAFGKEMQKYLGPDALKGSIEDVIYRFSDFLHRVQSPTQRAGLLRLAAGGTGGGGLGGGGVALAQFFGQGSTAMKAQVEQLKAQGEIISQENIEKLYELDKAWINLKATLSVGGVSALTGFVDGFQHLSSTVTNQDFQDGLRTVGKLLGEITKTIGGNPRLAAALAGAGVGGIIGGLPGAAVGGIAGFGGATALIGQSDAVKARQLKTLESSPLFRFSSSMQEEARRLRLSGAYPADHSPLYVLGSDKPKAPPSGGGIDLSGSLTESAYSRAVEALKLRTQALRDGSGEFANYTQAQEAARAKTELMTAAEQDAAKAGTKVTQATIDDINRRSQAYGEEAAAKAFARDEGAEDDRIAKLKAEAASAGATARQLAELLSMERQLQDFHKANGDNSNPDDATLAAMHAKAAKAGSAQAGADWAKAVDQAQKQIDQGQARNSEIGLFGPQLASAQMRMQLLNAAMQAGQPITADVLATITRLSTAYGALAQAAYTTTESFERQRSVTDELRTGLDNIATAGLHGFNSLKSAASGFMDQLASLILKLYVVQPLLEQAFGPPGTAGGGTLGGFLTNLLSSDPLAPVTVTPAVTSASGGIGGLFSNLFNFANGGVMTPSGPRKLRRFASGGISSSAAIFGEAGIEAAVPLPDGRSIPVSLRAPPTPSIPQLQTPSVNVTYAPVNQITGDDPSTVARVRSLIQSHEANMPALIHNTVTQMARRKAGPWN